MRLFKKALIGLLGATMVLSVTACSNGVNIKAAQVVDESESVVQEGESDVRLEALSSYNQDMESLKLDNSAWQYDATNDVYWQIGIKYCTNPETTEYETMGIYIPGAYMIGASNGDGTYTCTINLEGEINGYTAQTAPIVMPVNTAGYSAQAAPTSYNYESIADYMDEGFIYVYAGMRGRSNGYDEAGNLTYSGGAPWGVTDLKAAVRYYRFNSELLPGNAENIFTFGHSGGGAQSALMGATGDSTLYYEYLTSIGAAMFDEDGNYISDAIAGAMSWCPITSLDYANEAYEWQMGQFSSEGTRQEDTWTSALSDDLAESYATYINALGLTDSEGKPLTLEASETGIYTAGSYYDYLMSLVEESLNNFLSDTTFPYTESKGFKADGGFGGGGRTPSDGGIMPGKMPDGELPEGAMPNAEGVKDGNMKGEGRPLNGNGPGFSTDNTEPKTYETVQDYIDALNSDETWVQYDESTNTATITSMEDFVQHCKNASKSVAAFDDLERGQAENMLFGNDENNALHFDETIAKLLEANQETYATFADWNEAYIEAYTSDLGKVDKMGNTIAERMNMYNPMYFVSDYYEGYNTSNVAKYWRIHTGIEQGDTALTVEANLALALEKLDEVESVDFETVWEQGHTLAERTGTGTENFIEWVNSCIK